jgi:carboxyl-terminal processing protease
MQNHNLKLKTYLILGFTLSLCAFSFSFFAFVAEPNSVAAPVGGDPGLIVKQLCSNIYKGDFAASRALLGGSTKSKSTAITQLINIISEYEAIEQRRQSSREAAYAEKLAELEKFRVAEDTNDVNDVNDPNNMNDPNNISKVLLVIANVAEFADEAQKGELLSEPFVKQVFQKAIDKAAEFESKGKWLDAYTNCYYWLKAIDANNEAYSDYADQLYEKANIVASFQDSPCETRKERFQGVKEERFVRAINALESDYVSRVIDYLQMATKAISRCELLAEVMNCVPGLVTSDPNEPRATRGEMRDWSAGLATLLNEVSQSPTGMSKDNFIDVFEKVLALNSSCVKREADIEDEKRDTLLPNGVLIAQFAEASLSALDDYTVMVWPKQVQDFEEMMTNEFTGIGIRITKEKGLLTVASLLPDTPAYHSGLDAGDLIEKVDGVETEGMSLACAKKEITGPKGTKVTLTIRRPVEEHTRDIIITRAKITVPTIRGWQRTEAGRWLYMIDDANRIGYVRITSFTDRTADDFEKVLGKLEAEGLKGLILDLRFNSGGLLNSATEVTDKFLEGGLIVSTRPRRVWTYISAKKKGTHPNYPLVVLINSSSASASEIVAGAFGDPKYKRAILVGERTHGKGSVQGITSYPRGGAQLKYTMAYYHLPSGQRVESQDAVKKRGMDDWGIGPDIEVKLRSDELIKMSEVQWDNLVLARAGHDNEAEPLKKHTVEETLATDPQLAVGVLIVKSKLICSGVHTLR